MRFAAVSRWHVVFYGRAPRGLRWLVRDGFRHCGVFGYCVGIERWVWVNASLSGLSVHFLDVDALAWRLESLHRLGCSILQGPDFDPFVRRVDAGVVRGFWRLAPWCVAVSASVVGSSSRALRPHGFYRDLVRDGWKTAFMGDRGGDAAERVCDVAA